MSRRQMARLIAWPWVAALLHDVPRAPLWAQGRDEDDESIQLWKAALLALVVELSIQLIVFGIDWSKLAPPEPPTAIPVMSVKLDQPPKDVEPAPPPRERKPQQ